MIRVGIFGVGLMGGSLGMALRRVRHRGRRVYHITGYGRNPANLKKARGLKAIDDFDSFSGASIKKLDIAVLCVPVQTIYPLAQKIVPKLPVGSIVTDVGSVKSYLVDPMAKLLKKNPGRAFVGGHPMAGSEKSGVVAAHRDLYQGATCALITDNAPKAALAVLKRFWTDVGGRPIIVSALEHDEAVALTSHLPHLVSFSLFSLFLKEFNSRPKLKQLAAGSFRDFTRIAGADPHVWSGILSTNKGPLQKKMKQLSNIGDTFLGQQSFIEKKLSHLVRAKRKWNNK